MLARLGGAAAFDPGRPGVRVLVTVAVLVVIGAAVLAWWSQPRPEPVVPVLTATAPPSLVATTPAELVVAVTGKVREPGLVRLLPGARVADAIEAAGGVLPDAELDYLNLARRLTDGELIVVGMPPPPEQAGGAPGAAAVPGAGVKVNLNTATQSELETLPGVGPALAQRIIDHRTRNGPFGSVTELRQVAGIGEVRFAELRDLVTV
jgi:competence protein ComEA